MAGYEVQPLADLLAELGRHLRAADALLAGLADDMAAAGAASASERAERVRAELRAAEEIAIRMHAPGNDTAAW
jgi:hypothetical protein